MTRSRRSQKPHRGLLLAGFWGVTACLAGGWAPVAGALEPSAPSPAGEPWPVASVGRAPGVGAGSLGARGSWAPVDWAQHWWVPASGEACESGALRVVELRGAWTDGELRGLAGLRSLRSREGAAVPVALVVAEVRSELDPEWISAARRAGVALGQARPAWLVERHGESAGRPATRVIDSNGATLFAGSQAGAQWVVDRWRAGTWSGVEDVERLQVALEVLASLTPELSPRVRLARLSELHQSQPDLRELTYDAEFTALLDLGHTREAWSLGRRWLDRAVERGDALGLERLVSEILANRPKVWMPDLELGLRAARSACELTGQRDAHLLAQLARVHYLRGEFDSACKVMDRALERAKRSGELGPEELATWRACQARYDRAAGG